MNIDTIARTAAGEILDMFRMTHPDKVERRKARVQRVVAAAIEEALKAQPQLTVWEGAMPESNGRSNFTAILRRKTTVPFDRFEDLEALSISHTIARSEYPYRVKYEADRVRYLLGELAKRPRITDYDADTHSDYVPRDHERFISFYDLRKHLDAARQGQGSYHTNYDGAQLGGAIEAILRGEK